MAILGSALVPTVLEAGKQELLVVASVSPLEVYITDMTKVEEFTQTPTARLNMMGETADYVHLTEVGDLVLAFKEECWNRASVMEILQDNRLKVRLIDYAETIEIEKKMVRTAPEEALEFPVLVAKCSLDSFHGREEKAAKQVEKLVSLGLDYKPVEGEVLGSQDGVTRVKIPSVECQLSEQEPKSRWEAILKKLMKK